MSAAARAEARRKAILARGGDRLAKLTSSARGDDAPAFKSDDPPLAPLPNRPGLEKFVGEQTDLPTPPTSRNVSGSYISSGSQRSRDASGSRTSASFSAAGLGDSAPDPSVWSEEQQTQFLNALLGGSPRPAAAHGQPRIPSASESSLPPDDNPMAALMANMAQFTEANGSVPPGGVMPGFEKAVVSKSKSTLQKFMPIIHLITCWALLAYFVLWREPAAYETRSYGAALSGGRWQRWAELGSKRPEDGWGVQAVPFFWAFTTLTLVLHSWRVFYKLDVTQPPMLLALALPYMPPLVRAIITNGLAYVQIGGVLLDDIAGLMIGVGLLVWIAGWVADS
ncbi:hypothetical protein B0H21DRAFT_889723 [Amylocystis lapponica]|nr:hypothetical protein B0H21DRAFT_889723 [Amylocystis lapponica]